MQGKRNQNKNKVALLIMIRRKPLNILVCGRPKIGKQSFIRTLEAVHTQKVLFSSKSISNLQDAEDCLNFINSKYQNAISEEKKVHRDLKIFNSFVHVVFYLVDHHLWEREYEFISLLSKSSNVIPVIARSDCLTLRELENAKVKLGNFDCRAAFEYADLNPVLPKTVFSAEFPLESNFLGRIYSWGSINVLDSDIKVIVDIIQGLESIALVNYTRDVYYEEFRFIKLN